MAERRQRWVIIVGGAPGPMGYVELAHPTDGEHTETGPLTQEAVVRVARTCVRDRGGRVPVCVWRAGGRWPARSPTWWYDPRGLPEAWAPRGAPDPVART